jgi:hypothetical protein
MEITTMRGKLFQLRAMLLLLWSALSVSAFGVTGRPSTITYVDATGQRRVYSFAIQDCIVVIDNTCGPQHLVVNHLINGTSGWEDLGVPTGATSVSGPATITYLDAARQQHINTFAVASGGALDKHLVVNSGDGTTWSWANADMGAGADNSGVQSVSSAVIFVDSTGNQRIYVFVVEFSGRLAFRSWNGFYWMWHDIGVPSGATSIFAASAVSYSVTSYEELQVFVSTNSGQLSEVSASVSGCSLIQTFRGPKIYCPPETWQWSAFGAPEVSPTPSFSIFWPTAITYVDAQGNQQIFVFLTGFIPGTNLQGGDLLALQKLGNDRSFRYLDFGIPPGKTGVEPGASAITYLDASGNPQIYVSAEANDGHLVTWSVDGSSPDIGLYGSWADQGLPAGKTAISSPDTITYLIPACQGICLPYFRTPHQEIESFAVANDGHLVVNANAYGYSQFLGGFTETWYWTDQGTR